MRKSYKMEYRFFRNRTVYIIAGLSIGLLQILIFAIYKRGNTFFTESFNDSSLFFKRIIIDRILIESLSIFILIFFFLKFKKYLASYSPQSAKELFVYNIKCLPIVLVSLLVFTPIAILLRYLWRNGFVYDEATLVRYFGNFRNIYFQTLLPFSFISYLLVNLNLIFQKRNKGIKENNRDEVTIELLEVINENGKTLIEITDVLWIEKRDRIYEVKTFKKTYFIRKTITELEILLTPLGFIKVNRSVIANRNYIYNYSFWEFDKFILRMNDTQNTEFIVSRDRMKKVKKQIKTTLPTSKPE